MLETLFDEAVALLKQYEPTEGYYLAFSGGKDSIVIHDIVKRSGVKFDAHFTFTTVDPPELKRFIRDNYPYVEWHYPKQTMFQLVRKNGLPSIFRRWCCRYLKEYAGSNRTVITGIRKKESNKRAKRSQLETSYTDKTKKLIHLIFDWSSEQVWEYINALNLPYCKLYDEGWNRIGCIGCPMSSKKEVEMQFERYPNFRKAYINSAQINLDKRKKEGKLCHFETGTEMFDWWISRKKVKKWQAEKEQIKIDFTNETSIT